MTIKDFIKKRPYLLWSVSELDSVSEEVIVEAVLNYGDFADVQKMIEILKIEKVAEIFEKQIKQKRNNYRPKIKNYFKLYFEKYA
ncbi:hypothetical protein K0B03_04460 [Patescibacteria group bacterium]|nr:hypothetical protein [Patescibacteria group bacterium]